MWAIIDTSIYVGHWERGLHAEALDQVRKGFIVRHSAVTANRGDFALLGRTLRVAILAV